MPVPETQDDHLEPSKRNYLLNADGSGSGTTDNPALGAIGVVLRDPDGHPIAEISKRIGPAINTVGEYRPLIEGLRLARSRGIQRIRVFLDSELVVDQVNGRAKVDKEHIRLLHTEACALLQEFATSDFVGPAKMECRSGRTCHQSASWPVSAPVHTGTAQERAVVSDPPCRPTQIPSTSVASAVSNGCDSDTEPDSLATSAHAAKGGITHRRRTVVSRTSRQMQLLKEDQRIPLEPFAADVQANVRPSEPNGFGLTVRLGRASQATAGSREAGLIAPSGAASRWRRVQAVSRCASKRSDAPSGPPRALQRLDAYQSPPLRPPMDSRAIDRSRQTEGTHVVYLIVGLDRRTFARWHRNVMAPDVKTAEQIARDRAAAEGVRLIVAATIGPHSSIVDEPIDTSVVRVA